MLANVLLDSTRNEKSKWDGRVFLKESQHMIDELLYPLLVLTFVKTIDDEEEGPLVTSLLQNTSVEDNPKRREDQEVQLRSQGHLASQ